MSGDDPSSNSSITSRYIQEGEGRGRKGGREGGREEGREGGREGGCTVYILQCHDCVYVLYVQSLCTGHCMCLFMRHVHRTLKQYCLVAHSWLKRLHVQYIVPLECVSLHPSTLLPLSLPSPTPSSQKHYNLDITMLSYDVSILYAFFMNPAKVKERMNMP